MGFIISLIACLIVYYLFDTAGFKKALIFKVVVSTIELFLLGLLNQIGTLGMAMLLVIALIMFVITLITTAIEYWAYNKTSNFITYFLLSGIVEFLVMFAVTFIISYFTAV